MKEKDLYIDFKPQQHIYYVEKEDHSYGPIMSGSQLSKNYLDDYFLKMGHLEESLRKQVLENKISPIHYFITIQDISTADLASRAGICHARLKKHLKPEGFAKIPVKLLKKYAEIFNIPVANLFQLVVVKEEDRNKTTINQFHTENPFFIITKVESK
jgi:hypothetical protein